MNNNAKTRRSIRVILVVFALLMFNIGDLYMTLQYQSLGLMIEQNVIAAPLVYYPSPVPLICYKTVVVFSGLFLVVRFRHRISVEIASWALLLAFVLLTFKWLVYIEAVHAFAPYLPNNPEERKQMLGQFDKSNLENK